MTTRLRPIRTAKWRDGFGTLRVALIVDGLRLGELNTEELPRDVVLRYAEKFSPAKKCISCGGVPDLGLARCAQCRADRRLKDRPKERQRYAANPDGARARQATKRARWRRAGQCTQCGRDRDSAGLVRCAKCRTRTAKAKERAGKEGGK